LLVNPFIGSLGCGSVRTVAEYEAYSGISFYHQKVQDYTLRGAEPPNPEIDSNWHESIRRKRGRINIELDQVAADALTKAQCWLVSIYDATGIELHRIDLSREVLDIILANHCDSIMLQCEFDSGREPARWSLLPFSYTEGWLERINGVLSPQPG
jgi:hypothetical protein